MLDDVRRVREDSRGDDASEVVREVVRRVDAHNSRSKKPKALSLVTLHPELN